MSGATGGFRLVGYKYEDDEREKEVCRNWSRNRSVKGKNLKQQKSEK